MALTLRFALPKAAKTVPVSSFKRLPSRSPTVKAVGVFPSKRIDHKRAISIRPCSAATSAVADTTTVTRDDFPADFKFGCATSALQTEGSGTEGGRGPSTWDNKIQDDKTPGIDIATDSYNRYKDDVKLLVDMGVDTYRFSISWSRLLPDGTIDGGINQQGIDFYNKFIDELVANGITPFATLFHFDLPTTLDTKYGGFLSIDIVFLEPMVYGDYPFAMRSLLRDNLPVFTDEQKELVKGSYDYIGVNYYTSYYADAVPITNNDVFNSFSQYQYANVTAEGSDGEPIGPATPGSSAIYVYPEGLKKLLIFLKSYENPKIYITENGYPDKNDDKAALLEDDVRIKHIQDHLAAIRDAIKAGTNVKGYLMWALLDCMEMGSPYAVRFGLNYTDYEDNLNRSAKKSAVWLKDWLAASTSK